MITQNSITFGKYKGATLDQVLRDRPYCKWLIDQDWFKSTYEYLYNRVKEYDPRVYFLDLDNITGDDFIDVYPYFNLKSPDKITITLNTCDLACYEFYLQMIREIKMKIYERMENEEENPYDIKAPVKWLQKFEQECCIPRASFKEFIGAYELPNITTVIENVKKEGGIEYKGAKSFIIAKSKSKAQEKWWEDILRAKYGEDISPQYKYENCLFDFLNIKTSTIFESKLGLKDFNDEQHRKYKLALKSYRVIYLIDRDCVIHMENRKIYSTNTEKYELYLHYIPMKKKMSYLDKIMISEKYELVHVESVESLFGTN